MPYQVQEISAPCSRCCYFCQTQIGTRQVCSIHVLKRLLGILKMNQFGTPPFQSNNINLHDSWLIFPRMQNAQQITQHTVCVQQLSNV